MSLAGVTLPLAFAAGLVSVLSPCVMPLLPAYLAYLARPGEAGSKASRVAAFGNATAFIAGLSLVFVLFFYALSSLLSPVRQYVPPVAGALVIVIGLYVARLVKLPFLDREVRLLERLPLGRGPSGAFVLGLGFAAGWTPCIGVTLGAVLGSAVGRGPSVQGLILMLAYCLGLGLPFLVLGLAINRGVALSRAVAGHRRAVDLASGGVLVAMGLVLLTNNLTLMTQGLSHLLPSQFGTPFGL